MEWDDCAPTYQASQNLRYTRWARFLTKQAPSQLPNCAPSHTKSPGKSNTLLRNLPDKQEHHTKYNNQPFHPSSLSFLSLLASQQTVLYDELSQQPAASSEQANHRTSVGAKRRTRAYERRSEQVDKWTSDRPHERTKRTSGQGIECRSRQADERTIVGADRQTNERAYEWTSGRADERTMTPSLTSQDLSSIPPPVLLTPRPMTNEELAMPMTEAPQNQGTSEVTNPLPSSDSGTFPPSSKKARTTST